MIFEVARNLRSFCQFCLTPAIELENNESIGALEIIGTDLYGRKSRLTVVKQAFPGSIHLHDRILAKRTKTRRTWDQGSALEADWFLDDGSKFYCVEMKKFQLGISPLPISYKIQIPNYLLLVQRINLSFVLVFTACSNGLNSTVLLFLEKITNPSTIR